MVIKKHIERIVLVVLMLSVVTLVMATAPTINITTPGSDGHKINGTSFNFIAQITNTDANVTVNFNITNSSSWPGRQGPDTSHSGNDFYFNLDTTTLADGDYTLNVTAANENITLPNSSYAIRTFRIDNVQTGPQFNFTIEVNSSSQETSPNKNATYIITLNHTGTNDTDFLNLMVKNENGAATASLSETLLPLSKGVPINVFLNVTDESEGSFKVTVDATSTGNHDITKSVSTTTNVISPFNVSLTVDSLNRTVPRMTNATYMLTLKNTGQQTDSYNLSVENGSAQAFLSQSNITDLPKGASIPILLNISSLTEGTFSVNVTATSANDPNKTASISTATSVISSFNVSLTVDSLNRTVPRMTNATYMLTLKNTGQETDSYNLTVENGSALAVLSQFNTNLTKGNSLNIFLNVSNPTDGTFIVDVTATSINNPNKTAKVTTTTEVKTIHDLVLNVTPPHGQVSLKENATFTIEITNTGNVNDTFNINTSDTARAILSKVNTGNLQPKDKDIIKMNFSSSTSGNFTVRITATSQGNSSVYKAKDVTIFVPPKSYYTGDRIWDENRHSHSQYSWNVYSFSGFYYNLDDDLGNECLTITNIDRSIAEGEITYSTSPEEVGFEHSGFGSYHVIGFMADKYFAGYSKNSSISGNKEISTIGSSQLHRVLLDDDEKRTVSEGGTLTLKEGYVLKITAVDVGAGAGQVWITLLKDGGEVDSDVVAGGEDYYYIKKVGSVSDLPIIAVHFDSVFRGREVNAVFIKGAFQISESYTQIKSGSKYGVMEVDSVTPSLIKMKNDNAVDLSKGNTVDLMGNLKIKVADNDTLRFGLSSEQTGTFEVRGTIYDATGKGTNEWTPMNFGMNIGGTSIGFYYDIDEDIGNERLWIDGDVSGTSLQSGKLKYSTSPQEVSFDHSGFGSYQVIGFMADKYFAGYSANSEPSGGTAKSTIGSSQLHRVLLDDDEKRTVSEGGTLTLQEGYVLKITAVDVGAGAGQVWITLLKDGGEVDSDVVAGGEDYYYIKKVGSVSDLPIIAVHFDSVFRGREVNAVFIRGVFQISESYTQVKSGNTYGAMEITGASSSGIKMENDNTIDLSQGSTSDVMGNIKFRVADSGDLRFYPFVTVTEVMIANQLVIDAPAKANAGNNITIKVTAGGSTVDNASVSIDSEIRNTDGNGVLDYTLPITMKGTYNITATKLGYEKASRSIEIAEYIEYRLSIDAPAKANQFETITILVKYNTTAISGAIVKYDNDTIGATDSNGALNYTPQTSGMHTISVSKSGYITVSRDIEVIAPFSEYKALDINITPAFVFPDQKVVIRSNITNAGTKADTLPVDLIINGSVVDNLSVALDPHATKEINFTGNLKEWVPEGALPGNYTVEILGQKGLLEVKEEPLNIFLIGGIATVFGAIIIYLLTAKKKLSIEAIRKLLGKFGKKGVGQATPPGEGKV